MKQLFFAFLASTLIMSSCTSEEKKSAESSSSGSSTESKREKNLASARAVAKAFETGNTSGLDSVVADDFLDHTERGDKIGRDSLKAMITMMHKTANDMKMETIREVADDEYVFQWLRYTGTSDGSMGPAGPYDMRAIEVSRYKDGKVAEHWAYMDAVEMMKMMAAVQQPAKVEIKDSIKK